MAVKLCRALFPFQAAQRATHSDLLDKKNQKPLWLVLGLGKDFLWHKLQHGHTRWLLLACCLKLMQTALVFVGCRNAESVTQLNAQPHQPPCSGCPITQATQHLIFWNSCQIKVIFQQKKPPMLGILFTWVLTRISILSFPSALHPPLPSHSRERDGRNFLALHH